MCFIVGNLTRALGASMCEQNGIRTCAAFDDRPDGYMLECGLGAFALRVPLIAHGLSKRTCSENAATSSAGGPPGAAFPHPKTKNEEKVPEP